MTGTGGPQRRAASWAGSWAGLRPWAPWLAVVLVAGRLLAVVGLRPYVYVDSGEYLVLDLTGRSRRPWATPLLYELVPGQHRGEVVAQALVGGLAWTALAVAVAAWFPVRRVGLAAAATVAALGLTTSVTNWDTAILSESLALSLTVALVAAWLQLVRRPGWWAAAAVVALTLPWLFVRQSLLPTAWLVVAVAVGAAVLARRRAGAWRPMAATAAALLVLTVLASWSYTRNQEVVRTNLTVIVANRVVPDAERLAWFRDHGMPVPASGALDVTSLTEDPAFSRWVAGEGRRTYLTYLASHPWYTLTEPLDDLVGVRRSYGDEPAPQVTMLSPADGYGMARPVIPEVLEAVLFGPGATGTVVAALALALGASVARYRHRDRRWAVSLALIGLSLAALLTGWHGATPELGRLAIVAAVALRIGLILHLAVVVEGALLPRREAGAPGGAAYPRAG